MPKITILGTVIDYPDSTAAPNWSEALIQFATQVEKALLSAVGSGDVAPQTIILINDSLSHNVDALLFSGAVNQSATLFYSVYRQDNLTILYEAGQLELVYDGSDWHLSRIGTGDAHITFSISSSGQLSYTMIPMAGTSVKQYVTFRALSNIVG